ncbi:MAG: BrnT family toxin [Spirochaetaceae bacterium]|jgi:uncharacterized DUF497 family protein|nr:BrnT family toxin [Spirochaetaceae bacterium]
MGDVVYKDKFIWDAQKAELNLKKHRVRFETAAAVFSDPFLIEEYDRENSTSEDRFNVTGSVTGLASHVLVTVSVTYRGGFIRVFSARRAEAVEAGDYYDQFRQYLR